jgi:DNA-binding NtrC family response regulator
MANQSLKVLIIDDESSIRIFLKDVFERAGYTVVLAANGSEGLACARKERFDIIITDMVMPDLQGADMIAQLRTSGFDTPLVAMTGYSDGEANLAKAKDYCVDCVLYKPFVAEEVIAAVERVLQNRKLRPMSGRG